MKVGLTGLMGAGKSQALKHFQGLGWRVASCDEWVRQLLEKDPAIREAICQHWGEEIKSGQAIDRKKIASIVFNNPLELQWIEATLLPKTLQACQEFLDVEARTESIVEVPLLFEKNWGFLFDYTVAIIADPTVQQTRLEQRGLSSSTIAARLQCQMPTSEKIQRADFVITNNGTLSVLHAQIELFSQKI